MSEKIISVFGCDQDEQRLFEQYAARSGLDVRCCSEILHPGNVHNVMPGGAVSVNHRTPVDARLIQMLYGRGVRYLSSRSVGLDHIDMVAARAAGMLVESVSYSPESVAEYALMLMLMATRNAGHILRRMSRGDFRLEERRAVELRDMTVGVVGTGRIGKAVIERLSCFGCQVVAYDPCPSAQIPYVGLDELLGRCDLVTLHLPLTDASWHLLDRARIASMRRGAILVNTARGALIDLAALRDALEQGALACAALDVVEGEEGWFCRDCSALTPPFARLLALPNAIVTPHTAFYTEHALRDVVENTLEGFLNSRGGIDRWVG